MRTVLAVFASICIMAVSVPEAARAQQLYAHPRTQTVEPNREGIRCQLMMADTVTLGKLIGRDELWDIVVTSVRSAGWDEKESASNILTVGVKAVPAADTSAFLVTVEASVSMEAPSSLPADDILRQTLTVRKDHRSMIAPAVNGLVTKALRKLTTDMMRIQRKRNQEIDMTDHTLQ